VEEYFPAHFVGVANGSVDFDGVCPLERVFLDAAPLRVRVVGAAYTCRTGYIAVWIVRIDPVLTH
jgi:hypothetical protein